MTRYHPSTPDRLESNSDIKHGIMIMTSEFESEARTKVFKLSGSQGMFAKSNLRPRVLYPIEGFVCKPVVAAALEVDSIYRAPSSTLLYPL